ncbi:cytochrome-c oxidase, subunit VIIa [Syncephalis pseudoplumigaleata]|uniref:Cytochrome-c oxidase, subunit VIIa n=1 Tax=Syncephalis pseudoplumigaleata TaxID=1712513 RepID=A0A4V1J1C5_9FUNG|nr:cytochrome-c oxidase, subunit VIIa [Syncephalis pseudoplumigaleata]|eukprot:RKP24579.1 cytochrome-c oxidase, subunit VIIa [Syncephalis pseudoplumigaleata]
MTAGPRIVGTFKRGALRDIAIGFALSLTAGYAFKYGYFYPSIEQRNAFYQKLNAAREE